MQNFTIAKSAKMKSSDIDLEEIIKIKQNSNKLFASKPMATFHEFYLTGRIEEADQYIAVFDMIRHATSEDVVKIYVNSPGGDLFTALQFGRAMGDSDATIIVSVEGQCCSAATIIALAADMVELSNHCVWMCHNYSSGTFGKGGEMYDQMSFERTWSEGLFRDVYDGFLTDKEINAMLDGRDIWLAADDVMKRLEQRHNKMKRKAKKAMQEIKMTQIKEQDGD